MVIEQEELQDLKEEISDYKEDVEKLEQVAEQDLKIKVRLKTTNPSCFSSNYISCLLRNCNFVHRFENPKVLVGFSTS